MYVCGMTVYDYLHLGHARMLVAFDVVQRWLRASGYRVTYVRNITDIDDKIIRRALENGESIGELTARFIRCIDEDAAALGVQKPDHEPRATQYVPQMVDMIAAWKKKSSLTARPRASVNFGRASLSRVRQAFGEIARRAALRRTRGSRHVQGGSARLRAVEALQARRRSGLRAGAKGRAGLAHRVLRDERRAARRAL